MLDKEVKNIITRFALAFSFTLARFLFAGFLFTRLLFTEYKKFVIQVLKSLKQESQSKEL